MKRKTYLILLLLFILIYCNALAKNENDFENELLYLKSPAETAIENGVLNLRINDTIIIPFLTTDIIPTDKTNDFNFEPENVKIELNNNNVVIENNSIIKAVKNGKSILRFQNSKHEKQLIINISDNNIPIKIQNLVYIAKKEFLSTKMKHLPKFNKYAKWYYKKHREVGWCSVFLSYCNNASGMNTFKYKSMPDVINDDEIYGILEGQVGTQWDAYVKKNRFTTIPKIGYPVIYGNTKNGYKYTHIGLVVDLKELSDGKYIITTVEGNMSNTVKSYTYVYDSKKIFPQKNMSEVSDTYKTGLSQYKLHTDTWAVFGFLQNYK